MKATNLMLRIAARKNLMEAWKKVRANKGAPGLDGQTIAEFEANLEANLDDLAQRLREDRYFPMPPRRFAVAKKDGRQRPLAILTVEDRIVQRAFFNVLEPLFERVFLDCSFGFRPGRNIGQAVERVLAFRQQGFSWVVDADIEAFFDSIDHALLMGLLKEHIADRAVLRTIEIWLEIGALREEGVSAFTLFQQVASFVRTSVAETARSLLLPEYSPMTAPSAFSDGALDDGELTPSDAEDWERLARKEALRRLGRELLITGLAFHAPLLRLLTLKRIALGGAAVAAVAAGTTIAKRAAQRKQRLGTPQGSPLSPLLANIYLHPFDVAMTRQGFKLVRYADDFVICCKSEGRARHALKVARQELAKLRLRLKEQKTKILSSADELCFLGHVFDGEGAFPQEDPKATALVRHLVRQAALSLAFGSRAARQTVQSTKTLLATLTAGVAQRVREVKGDKW